MGTLMALWFVTAQFVWQPPDTGTPTAYVMARRVNEAAWHQVAVIDVPATTWTDPATARGINCYRVVAQTATVTSTPSNEVCLRCNTQRCRPR